MSVQQFFEEQENKREANRALPGLTVEPKAVSFRDAPPGLCLFGGTLVLKTEYFDEKGFPEAFVCESGEAFWGGVSTRIERDNLPVFPVNIQK